MLVGEFLNKTIESNVGREDILQYELLVTHQIPEFDDYDMPIKNIRVDHKRKQFFLEI